MFGIYGLIGERLGHSLSPSIHEMLFDKNGFPGKYNLFEVKRECLKDAVRALKVLGIKGANVTIPYKVDIIKYLDELSPEAEKIGAINTITISGNKATGSNTDYFGFGMALKKHGIQLKGKTAVILGTGGSSRAASQFLLDHDIGELIFVSRSPQKAKQYYRDFRIISYQDIPGIEGDILINCTPVGMFPEIYNCPVDAAYLKQFNVVFDLIYNPKQTLLIKSALEMDIEAVNGLYMLVCQAAKAQELWNQTIIDMKIIDDVYLEIGRRYRFEAKGH